VGNYPGDGCYSSNMSKFGAVSQVVASASTSSPPRVGQPGPIRDTRGKHVRFHTCNLPALGTCLRARHGPVVGLSVHSKAGFAAKSFRVGQFLPWRNGRNDSDSQDWCIVKPTSPRTASPPALMSKLSECNHCTQTQKSPPHVVAGTIVSHLYLITPPHRQQRAACYHL
jgi:hypothetical protein